MFNSSADLNIVQRFETFFIMQFIIIKIFFLFKLMKEGRSFVAVNYTIGFSNYLIVLRLGEYDSPNDFQNHNFYKLFGHILTIL